MKPIPHQPGEFLSRIHFIRGRRVMLDSDLAGVYGVSTKRLNEQVRRNQRRFPPEFMFQLDETEFENLRSQFATSSWEDDVLYLTLSPNTGPLWPPLC
ncbi:MAG: ORF6N domain-containing protein [Saprospiraceae bacterium]